MTRTLTACLVAIATTISAQVPDGGMFKARAEAVRRIDAARQNLTDPRDKAEMALHWAEAMDRAARALPFGRRAKTEPYASWVRTHQKYIVYNEPGGNWMLGRDPILGLHRTYAATDTADDIAWLLVTVGIGGECEGYLPCYVDREDVTYGEYLRLHPNGRHSEDATGFLRQWINSVLHEEPGIKAMFEPARDCGDLRRSLSSLRGALARTGAYRKEDVERGLDELASWCR